MVASSFRPRRAAVLVIALALAGGGCSRTYSFNYVATVTNEADGTPIAGATIRRNMWGEKSDPKTAETIVETDAAGQATEEFSVPAAAFGAGRPTWYLRVSKDGFEPAIVEIKPTQPPSEAHTQLDVPIKLRPVKK